MSHVNIEWNVFLTWVELFSARVNLNRLRRGWMDGNRENGIKGIWRDA